MFSIRTRAQLFIGALLALTSGTLAQQWTTVRLHDPADVNSQVLSGYGASQGGSRRSGSYQLPGYWNASSAAWTGLLPPGPVAGWVNGMSADSQVGLIGILGVGGHAALWHGTSESFVDLHTAGDYWSEALAVSGTRQGGYVIHSGFDYPHAAIWSGTAASMIDLHPPWIVGPVAYSQVRATDGDVQGGFVQDNSGTRHACLWHGSVQSFVDMNGSLVESDIYGMSGGQQVGSAGFAVELNGTHAAVWTGTPQSAIDLNPYAGLDSTLYATNGEYQVGMAHVPGFAFPHAGLWHGTAASFLDLNQFLPAGYSDSNARSVQMVNGLLYVAGTAESPNGIGEAWLWIGQVPAPGSAPLLLVSSLLAARRRRPSRC
jgi:hypothetical protein